MKTADEWTVQLQLMLGKEPLNWQFSQLIHDIQQDAILSDPQPGLPEELRLPGHYTLVKQKLPAQKTLRDEFAMSALTGLLSAEPGRAKMNITISPYRH